MGFFDNISSQFGEMWDSGEKFKILAAIAILALVIIGVSFLFSEQQPKSGELTVVVKNSSGQAIWKASAILTDEGGELSGTTDRDGKTVFSNIQTGKSFGVIVSAKGFTTKKIDFTLSKKSDTLEIKLTESQGNEPVLKTITFVGPDGIKLDKTLLSVELSCSSGLRLENPVQQISNGRLEAVVPSGCGIISARVSAAGFESAGFNLNESSIITLQEIETQNGMATIVVKDEGGRFLDNIEVTIKDSRSIPEDAQITSFGEAAFSLMPGSYIAQAYDNSQNFSPSEKNFTVSAKGEARVDIALSQKPIATIKLKVVDKAAKSEIRNATVVLKSRSGKIISREYTGGTLQLPITEHGENTLVAIADGYSQASAIKVNSSSVVSQGYTIELQKCTPSTCGVLKVFVKDEDNLPVANARVALLDFESGFFAENYGVKYTGLDGIAKFTGLKGGKYIAIAQKFPAEGQGSAFDVGAGVDFEAGVQLTIGTGTIEVKAVDSDGKAIPFGFAEFRSGGRDKLGKLPLDSKGIITFTTKADKKVFVTVSAQGYTNYTSQEMQISSGQSETIEAVLQKQILGDNPKIEFVGLFDESAREARVLAAGKTYRARFLLSVPQNGADDYEQLGVFVRTGDEKIVEKDSVYINSVNAPRTSVLFGSTYNEPNGTGQDLENLTNGEAKWALIVWDSAEIRQGIYEISVEVKVRDSTVPREQIPIFYRAFAEKGNGKILRDPIDLELGEGEQTSSKGGRYAKSYEKNFAEGGIEECDGQFCYSEKVLDIKNGLYLTAPYDLRIFGNYTLEFSITNNSRGIHDNSNLRIKNSVNGAITEKKLKIASYTITNADSQQFSSSAGVFELDPIALGNLRENKEIKGKLQLHPEILGETALDIKIVSDKTQVFSKQIAAKIVNEKDLNITVLPSTMPAFSDFDLNVEVKFFETDQDFLEVDGAFVRVERILPNRQKYVQTTTTNGDGIARVRIPASSPGTKIKVRVQKEGYSGADQTFEISRIVLSFNPTSIKSNLDLTTNTEQKLPLAATNLVPIPLTVTGMRFAGEFMGMLDSTKMNNYLAQYENKTRLEYKSAAQFTLLTAISDDAMHLSSPKKINARVVFEVSNENKSVTWAMEVPTQISISLSEPPKEPNCIEVSLKEWKDATLGGKAEAEFYIKNNCLSQNGKPLNLKSLKAKLAWKGNKYGNVELHVTDHDSGMEASEALGEGAYSTLFDSVTGGKEYTALAVFTPKGGTIGKRAEFTIIIDAAQNTTDGEQLVGSSNSISSQIDIIDLSECIKYTPDPQAGIILEENQGDAKLDIDSSACGNVTIDFSLCRGDKGCSGGVEGGIRVSPEEFTLKPGTPKKSVVVSRQEIPGMYGIGVFVRTPGSNYRQINNVDVLVRPTADDPFDLYKYDFSVKGTGSKDSTELINRKFKQDIAVDASICDWGDATEKGWWNWKGAGVGAVVGALMGIKPAMEASKLAANGTSQSLWKSFFGLKNSQKVSQVADKASENTIEGVCNSITTNLSNSSAAQSACSVTPAAAQSGAAYAQVQTANTSCQNVKNLAKQYNSLNTDAYSQMDAGIDAITQTSLLSQTEALYAKKQSLNSQILAQMQIITGQLHAAATQYAAAAPIATATCTVNPEACGCKTSLATAVSSNESSATTTQSYISSQYGEAAVKTGTVAANIAGTKAMTAAAQSTLSPVISATVPGVSSSIFSSPGAIMGMYTLGGFFIGGMYLGLMGPDPCSQRQTSQLPDYMINLLNDAGQIESANEKFSAKYVEDSARIIGTWAKQKMGIVVTNNGVSSARPVYDTLTFNAAQHLHLNPTKIEKGNKNFGPFNVPDKETIDVAAKIHVKLKTQEVEEQIPKLEFDTVSCVSGNKIRRTGSGALPIIKLNWNFGTGGIDKSTCVEQNENGVYCDAAQFSIMLSKRLNARREFSQANQNLSCPANPLAGTFSAINADLNGPASLALATSCYINNWSGYTDGEPTIKLLIEANKNTISWTNEIADMQSFMDTIHFNALLIKDGYSDDFENDFAQYYSNVNFFDTPDWFSSLAKDSQGRDYGVGRLFLQNKIRFTNRFFDSGELSSAGVHEILISIMGSNGKFNFFNSDGSVNANINIEFYLLSEPGANSAFYSVPFDGLVGLEGDSFNRQGYGTSYLNKDTGIFVSINNETLPAKTYNDGGSNPVTMVNSQLEKSFYSLNASASERGNLLRVGKTSATGAELKFAPSKATPVVLKMNAAQLSQDNLAAFYRITATESPVDSGQTATYWDGAGACLDNTGTLITESFDMRPDRAAQPRDPVLNYQSAYGVDFGPVNYTGDVYIRTVFYTNPLEQYALAAEVPIGSMQFITPDTGGVKVPLAGVSGEPFNNPLGGASGTVGSISDVFGLVEDGQVCVIDSGRKADFFWNQKSIYGMGKNVSISGLSNSLVAGVSCIGLGG